MQNAASGSYIFGQILMKLELVIHIMINVISIDDISNNNLEYLRFKKKLTVKIYNEFIDMLMLTP